MEIVSSTYYENLKRYWRRRKYQKMYGLNHEKKLKIASLGDQATLNPSKKPVKSIGLVAYKFHETYINATNRMAGSVAHKSSVAGAFAGKKVAKTNQISMAPCGEELVDNKLALEIYKRFATSRQINSIAY